MSQERSQHASATRRVNGIEPTRLQSQSPSKNPTGGFEPTSISQREVNDACMRAEKLESESGIQTEKAAPR